MAGAGFTLLDESLGVPTPGGRLWTIIDVAYGHSTDWQLRVTLEGENGRIAVGLFERPAIFRVSDEGDLLDYWHSREKESVGVGTLYSIDRSEMLSEFADSITTQTIGQSERLTHYLLAGMDTCVEVISIRVPKFATGL